MEKLSSNYCMRSFLEVIKKQQDKSYPLTDVWLKTSLPATEAAGEYTTTFPAAAENYTIWMQ